MVAAKPARLSAAAAYAASTSRVSWAGACADTAFKDWQIHESRGPSGDLNFRVTSTFFRASCGRFGRLELKIVVNRPQLFTTAVHSLERLCRNRVPKTLERGTGFEPATSTLGTRRQQSIPIKGYP